MIEDLTTIFCMYAFIVFKYFYFNSYIFDIQIILSTILMILLTWLTAGTIKDNDTKEIGYFFSHNIFLSVCISLVCNFISAIYDIIFYFGFINTVIIINFVSMFIMSDLIKKVKIFISNFAYGQILINTISNFYDKYFLSIDTQNSITEYIKYFLTEYVWWFIKKMYSEFMKINSALSKNNQSIMVKHKLNHKYDCTKNYIVNEHIQPYFIKSFQDAMNAPFNMSFVNMSFDAPYKNNLLNQDINMSSLKSIDLKNDTNNFDDFDDLDAEDDLTNIPTVSQQQIMDAERLDKEINELQKKESEKTSASTQVESQPKILSQSEQKAELKKKIAAKRSSRVAGKRGGSNKAMQREAQQLMNIPGMGQIMENMMKDSGLEKLMASIPADKMNQNMSASDKQKMQQLLESFGKKN